MERNQLKPKNKFEESNVFFCCVGPNLMRSFVSTKLTIQSAINFAVISFFDSIVSNSSILYTYVHSELNIT